MARGVGAVASNASTHRDAAGCRATAFPPPVDATFAAVIIKAFRVKGGKAGPKFWKGVREAVMKLCGTQDVILLITTPPECDAPAEQTIEGRYFVVAAAVNLELVDKRECSFHVRKGNLELSWPCSVSDQLVEQPQMGETGMLELGEREWCVGTGSWAVAPRLETGS